MCILLNIMGKQEWEMRPIAIPICLQQQIEKMFKSNPSLKADEFLNSFYEPGVLGEVRVFDAYRTFLNFHDLSDNNFPLSRFEDDFTKWANVQNATHPNCKQNNLILKKAFYKSGRNTGQAYYKNLCRIQDHLE